MKRSIFLGVVCLLFSVIGCNTTKPASSSSTTSNASTNDQEALNKTVLSIFQQPRQAAPEPPTMEILPLNFTPTGPLEKEVKFRDYTLRIYQGLEDKESSFEILQDGRRLYAKEGHTFKVEEPFGESDQKPFPMGMEITGDGQPNLIVEEYTGGAHCCFKYHVFEIGKRFRPIAVIYGGDSGIVFEDVNQDGKLEVVLTDWTYAYQFTCFAGSPAVGVVLRYKDDGYFVALDLMKKPAPTDDELKKKAVEVRAVYEKEKANPVVWGSPADLWAEMLELIYTGHETLAYKFFDMAWPMGMDGKEAALTKFKEVLLKSPFYREMNGIVMK
jgi:hypothetical protein